MKTKVRILLMSLVLMSTGCTQNVTVPEQYVAPEFLRIDYNVYSLANVYYVTLSAALTSTNGVEEAGFMIGTDETTMSYMSADVGDKIFTLKISNLQANTEFCFYATAGNSINEIRSELTRFRTPKPGETARPSIPDTPSTPDTPNAPTTPENPGDTQPAKPLPPPEGTGVVVSDANFKTYLLGLCDSNKDGKIEISEAKTVTSIDICTDNVTTLDGIQYFEGVKTLTCNGTVWKGQLKALALNANASLERLECNYNYITSFVLPASLKEFYCRFNTATSFNWGNATQIRKLDCFGNRLTVLDLSPLKELEELTCGMNSFKELDVSNNLKLKLLDLSDSPTLETVYVARGQKIENIIAENRINFKFIDQK